MLYLIATPIGNLKDITFRAIELLKECDFILCEDTRTSLNLMRHYDIQTPLKSYHQFNEASREDQIIEDLKNGKVIGLISDAGTPSISDPGYRLVKRCREEKLEVSSIPGACAAITALSGSGLPSDRFQFIGFLPKKQGQLQEVLVESILYEGTTISYESPHRLIETLKTICKLHKNILVSVCRELSKKFEEYHSGPAEIVLEYYLNNPPKGEIVLLIYGSCETATWKTLPAEELVSHFESLFKISSKEALKLAADKTGIPKRELYKKLL